MVHAMRGTQRHAAGAFTDHQLFTVQRRAENEMKILRTFIPERRLYKE